MCSLLFKLLLCCCLVFLSVCLHFLRWFSQLISYVFCLQAQRVVCMRACWIWICFVFVCSCAAICCLLPAIPIVIAPYFWRNNDSICTWNWCIKMKMHTRIARKQMKWICCSYHSQLILFFSEMKRNKSDDMCYRFVRLEQLIIININIDTLSQINICRFDRPEN